MTPAFWATFYLLISLNSCAPFLIKERSPSSLLKYPEFSFNRELIFNESSCTNQNSPFLTREAYKFTEFKEETTIDYYASQSTLRKRYDSVYNSTQRLKKRLFLRNGAFILPHNSLEVVVTNRFLNHLANQVEQAFKMNVVEYLFYPDFGHGHLYLPKESAQSSMEVALKDPTLKIVYHTAEQLMMKSGEQARDPLEYRQFKYRTRNIIGSFDNKASVEISYAHNNEKFNTLKEIPGSSEYENIGSTIYLSANQNGCVGYKVNGTTFFFDISFSH